MTLILSVAGLLGLTALYALLAVYAERKVSAFIQDRLGPMVVGPKGTLQTLADIVKLLQKELILPTGADKILFVMAPVGVFMAIVGGLAALAGVASLNVGLIFLIGTVSVDAVGILAAGWASNNKYSLLGAMRAVAQIISYEVPAGTLLLAAVVVYGSADLNVVAALQSTGKDLRFLGVWDVGPYGGFLTWGAVRYPHLLPAAILFFVAALAEAHRAPFDMPEAESELVAGYHTEYSGFYFALFMLAEYANMLLLCLLTATMFFGAGHTPFPNLIAPESPVHGWVEKWKYLQFAALTSGTPGTVGAFLWNGFWLLLKASALVFVMMWIRWTYPRPRADQLMSLCWKYLTPAALLLLLVSALVKVFEVG
jgi:NADH-quinone oxidoreductase subunit H